MSEIENGPSGPPLPDPLEGAPAAIVKGRSGVSLVWLIPIVALLIGGWLAVKTFTERGPTVKIEFGTASGLEAGKTKVKFKDVDIGQVTSIDVSADLKSVIVTAELKHGSEQFLTEKTRFWVERPRVTASGVSGLETLLSGSFIAIDPVRNGKEARRFKGLEEPPLFTTSEPGTRFTLRSPTLASLNIGAPVYYRQIQVGQVAGFSLDEDGEAVSIDVFVFAPHDRLVSTSTRFWNASGIDFSMSAAGVKVDTESLMSVLIGGVAFDTPDTIDAPGESPASDHVFPLYANRDNAHEKIYLHKERYLLFFDGSVRGLSVGAPVMLRGITIGKVLDIQLQLSVEDLQFHIPVLIEVEPERIAVRGDRGALDETGMIRRLVAKGLRAQLKTGSLITGQLYIELDFYPDTPPSVLAKEGDYDVLPTTPGSLEALTNKVSAILDRLEAFPFDRIGKDLTDTLAGASEIVNSSALKQGIVELEGSLAEIRALAEQLNTDIAPDLAETLRQTTATLQGVRRMIEEGSPISVELRRSLNEISGAARSLKTLTDYLERHPEALLRGKGGGR
ncbi:PqiB family protein [Thiocapsa marina]|uniref:Mammalian cell entry related domain protein n=1 Tax=Thiocapsa marina 5811 TaxID=768671 RepID=F9UB03_9GAMM|nr:MlaD family protein [Thiocapsa marina]EGV18621.1 Mammalian cell entry related domain protein [Thiocapsa marina 5811]